MGNKLLLCIMLSMLTVSLVSCKAALRKYRETQFSRKGENWVFYNALYIMNPEMVREMLEGGADPNYCKGEAGWIDSDPLSVVSERVYATYWRKKRGEEIPDPTPDITIFQLLIEAGADINKRPYIWDRISITSNEHIEMMRRIGKSSDWSETEITEDIETFVKDSNKLLLALLEAGADPDMLGHPEPYTYRDFRWMTDKKAKKYFAKGTRAINEAIEKGMIWESQVNLLLQYTTLDEESLEAAERSGDPAMIKKINALWEKEQDKVDD